MFLRKTYCRTPQASCFLLCGQTLRGSCTSSTSLPYLSLCSLEASCLCIVRHLDCLIAAWVWVARLAYHGCRENVTIPFRKRYPERASSASAVKPWRLGEGEDRRRLYNPTYSFTLPSDTKERHSKETMYTCIYISVEPLLAAASCCNRSRIDAAECPRTKRQGSLGDPYHRCSVRELRLLARIKHTRYMTLIQTEHALQELQRERKHTCIYL